jgi:hypothetical protein
MPLVQDYYSSPDALELIKNAFPEEDPEQNLIDAICAGHVDWWLFDEATRRRWPLPRPFRAQIDLSDFPYSSFKFHLGIGLGLLIYKEQRPEGPVNLDDMLAPRRGGPRTGSTIKGQLQIEREAFDRLFTPQSAVLQPSDQQADSDDGPSCDDKLSPREEGKRKTRERWQLWNSTGQDVKDEDETAGRPKQKPTALAKAIAEHPKVKGGKGANVQNIVRRLNEHHPGWAD